MHLWTIIVVPRLFEEKRRDIVFGFPSFRPSVLPSVLPSFRYSSFRPPNVVGTLCAQLFLQFCADSFETLQMFLSWSENMHVVWIYSSNYFCHFFQVELCHFLAFLLSKSIDSGYLVCASPPTVLCRFFRNFTYVFVMVWRYACGLDIILRFFLSLFPQVELSNFFRHFYYQSE